MFSRRLSTLLVYCDGNESTIAVETFTPGVVGAPTTTAYATLPIAHRLYLRPKCQWLMLPITFSSRFATTVVTTTPGDTVTAGAADEISFTAATWALGEGSTASILDVTSTAYTTTKFGATGISPARLSSLADELAVMVLSTLSSSGAESATVHCSADASKATGVEATEFVLEVLSRVTDARGVGTALSSSSMLAKLALFMEPGGAPSVVVVVTRGPFYFVAAAASRSLCDLETAFFVTAPSTSTTTATVSDTTTQTTMATTTGYDFDAMCSAPCAGNSTVSQGRCREQGPDGAIHCQDPLPLPGKVRSCF